jgi:hypothetical protein
MMGPYLLGCKWKGGTAREKELLAPSPVSLGSSLRKVRYG